MKNFLEFISEAATSQASSQAKKLNLKSDGHGGWLDSRGKFVAKTEGGKLKFYNQRDKAADEGPVQQMAKRRADDNLAGAPLQKKPAPTPKAKAKPQAAAEPKKSGGDRSKESSSRWRS